MQIKHDKKNVWILTIGIAFILFLALLWAGFFNYSDKVLTVEDIRKEQQVTARLNSTLSKTELLKWPRQILGKDARNGLQIVRFGRCSDICPDQAGVIMLYDGDISNDECLASGGDPVWATIPGYIGCRPKTN